MQLSEYLAPMVYGIVRCDYSTYRKPKLYCNDGRAAVYFDKEEAEKSYAEISRAWNDLIPYKPMDIKPLFNSEILVQTVWGKNYLAIMYAPLRRFIYRF